MKKLFITLTVILLSINYTYAGSCKIQQSTSPALLKYIENNRKVVKNISSEIIMENILEEKEESVLNQIGDELERYKGEIVKSYNKVFDFTGYYSYFEYYVTYPINSDVPSEIRRDYRLLEKELEGLEKLQDSIINNKKGEISIKNACKSVEVCDYEGKNSLEIIIDLQINLKNVMDLYRLSVIGSASSFRGEIGLSSYDNTMQIASDYNPKSYEGCITKKGGFFDTIKESISNIKLLGNNYEEGIQKWRDALDMLNGKTDTSQLEKDLLRKELNRQGVYGSNQENFTKALDEFNQDGLSVDNNFIVNTFNGVYDRIEKQIKKFNNEVIGDFLENKNEDISISKINKIELDSEITKNINERISNLYESQKPFLALQNANNDSLNSRIISTHSEIIDTINILEGTIKKAEKVCNSQDSSKGKCSYK